MPGDGSWPRTAITRRGGGTGLRSDGRTDPRSAPCRLTTRNLPMILSYDYPVLGVFWSMMIFFLWILWLMLLFRIFADIFRSDDLGGVAKALWVIFVIFLPFLGVFVYLIARGNSMTERQVADMQA